MSGYFGEDLIATEFGGLGFRFAQALSNREYEKAYDMFTTDLQREWSPNKLKTRFEKMLSYWDGWVTELEAMEGYDDYPSKLPNDLGGAYISIGGEGYSETVMVFVCRENGESRIREVIWGRP